jgi:protein-tyrosine-phosphatase
VLGGENGDIADPIGGPMEYYERSAAQIHSALEARIAELDL